MRDLAHDLPRYLCPVLLTRGGVPVEERAAGSATRTRWLREKNILSLSLCDATDGGGLSGATSAAGNEEREGKRHQDSDLWRTREGFLTYQRVRRVFPCLLTSRMNSIIVAGAVQPGAVYDLLLVENPTPILPGAATSGLVIK